MVIPVSISAFPVRGYSIAKDVVGVNTLVQSPLVVAGRPLNAWEGYNYKSFPRRLLVVIFPEETIPSWSRGGAPHPASAVMRTTLIAERKENIYGPPFLQTPRAPRMPPTPVMARGRCCDWMIRPQRHR